jgi:hypothetical protein
MSQDTFLWIPYQGGLVKTKVDQITVDQLAFGKLRVYGWSPDDGKSVYARITPTHEYLHRWLMTAPKGKVVDHINHDTLDNRRENLRIVDISTNVFNRKGAQKNNLSSGARGVSRVVMRRTHKGKVYTYVRWQAYFTRHGKRTNLGAFKTKAEAKRAVGAARSKIS